MKIYLYIVLVLFMVLLTGCVSLSSLQSGRTLGKGKRELATNINFGEYQTSTAHELLPELKNIPIIEFAGTVGVRDNLDLSFKFNTAFNLTGQIKYQFIGDKKSLIASSIGGDAGFNMGSPGSGIFLDFYLSIPLYLSIHPTEKLAFYLTPRLCHSTFLIAGDPIGDGEIYKETKHLNYAAFTYGIMFGKTQRFMIEISHSQMYNWKPTQVAVGFAFEVDASKVFSNSPQYPYYRGKRHKYK
jgi:hypothetical protein